MFKLQEESASIKWPVIVSVPQNGGKYTKQKFHLDFNVINIETAKDDFNTDDDETQNQAFFKTVITGFHDDVKDVNGEPLEFNDENLRRLINIPYVLSAIGVAYRDCISGHRRKN
ncbi:hypothetical protein JYT79_03570 [Cardiobacterium sp. AH-315-I02]|nr:hypothetical protein [Cardiobacterium sp. AH-315-I02]